MDHVAETITETAQPAPLGEAQHNLHLREAVLVATPLLLALVGLAAGRRYMQRGGNFSPVGYALIVAVLGGAAMFGLDRAMDRVMPVVPAKKLVHSSDPLQQRYQELAKSFTHKQRIVAVQDEVLITKEGLRLYPLLPVTEEERTAFPKWSAEHLKGQKIDVVLPDVALFKRTYAGLGEGLNGESIPVWVTVDGKDLRTLFLPKTTPTENDMTSSKVSEQDWKYALPAKPMAEGMLEVSITPPHKLHWVEYGNPKGEPVIFLHGGPGGAISTDYARFFDPKRYRILLFDQRGCGLSEPNAAKDPEGALAANTTQDVIADIEKLRAAWGVKGKAHIFGGSWGSTLALSYALAHPDHVQTLVLRGIFLSRKRDLDYFYQGNAESFATEPTTGPEGAYQMYPAAWKDFVEVIPPARRGDMVKAYAEIFDMVPKDAEEKALQDRAAIAWSVWEGITSYLKVDAEALGKFADPDFAKAFAKIENHYFMNGGFMGGKSGEANRENDYLLTHVAALKNIPIHIVQGKQDQVCPRFQADALVEAMSKAGAKVDYHLTDAGHSQLERENAKALTDIMDALPPMSRAAR